MSSKHPLPPVGHTVAAVQSPVVEVGGEGSGAEDCMLSSSLRGLESAKYRRLPSVQEDQCLPNAASAANNAAVDVSSIETLLQRAQLSSSSRRREPKDLSKDQLPPDPGPRPRSSALKPDFSLEALKDFTQRAPSSSKTLERLLSYENVPRPPTSKKDKDSRPVSKIERMSQSEARGLLRQASLERLGSSKLSSLVSAGPKGRGYSINGTALKDSGRIPTPEGRMVVSLFNFF